MRCVNLQGTPGFQVNEEMPKVRPIVLSCIQL